MPFANIVLFKKPGAFDDPLSYGVPQALKNALKRGDIVEVPFRNKKAYGLVVDLKNDCPTDFDESKIKLIERVVPDFSLPEVSIDLIHFMAAYYHASLTRCLRLMVPKRFFKGQFSLPKKAKYALPESIPDFGQFPLKPLENTLTSAQESALKVIRGSTLPVLLHGVTGSGKTELYLRSILKAVSQGKQALLLVPEIALTPQMVAVFKTYFGDAIALFHSKLNDSERAFEWMRVRRGLAPLAIGSRSAIFAPMENLGVLIIDEEHEWTYKQESSPYYDTLRLAEEIKKLTGCDLILGSATPRLESYNKAREGEYALVELPDRVHTKPLPKITVVDLREEFQKKNFSVLSLALQRKMQERLEAGDQVILFVNQRGMARAVVCRDCGYTEQCPHCEISLKFHQNSGAGSLICHYCNFKKAPSLLCPSCNSPHIRHVGVGTQRVEAEVHKLFPAARVVRADRDTTSDKEGFKPIYEAFLNRDYDVLVGTQMVAKGLDFEHVSLIGIILADIGLHIPDFRSHERLFALITQVAGRCGRGEKTGEVVLQTYQPTHFAIQQAAAYGYHTFAEKELTLRRKLHYPPFDRLIKFTVVDKDLKKLETDVQMQQELLEDILKLNNLPLQLSSAPAMMPKIAGQYYYHVLIRGQSPTVLFDYWKLPSGWRVDIDPVHTA